MRKPIHWEKLEDENRAILSAVALLKINFCLIMIDLEEEELDSMLWGYWEENKKLLRPHIYFMWRQTKKIVKKVMASVKKTNAS